MSIDYPWDAKDFRINEIAWRFWPWPKQLAVRTEILRTLAKAAAAYGRRVTLVGEGACKPLFYGRLAPSAIDTVVLEPAEHPAEVMGGAGFTLVHESPTAFFFERSVRLIKLDKRGVYRGRRSRTIAAASITASPTAKDVALFIVHGVERKARYVIERLSLRRILRFARSRGTPFAARLLRALALGGAADRLVVRKLELSEFLALGLLDTNELNALMRSAHFDLVTNGGTRRTLGAIVDLLKSGRAEMERDARDPAAIELSSYPRHLDRAFWDNGNTSLFNAMLAQFRHGVVPYEQIESIVQEDGTVLYSRTYYESLREMSDDEISKLLSDNPIRVHDGAVGSGRHRACAMIGRLAAGKEYIPFWVLKAS